MLRRFLVVSGVLAAMMTSACAPSYFGTHSESYTPGSGGWVEAGDLSLHDIVAVADQEGAATMVGTIVNRGDRADRLVSIAMPGGEGSLEPVSVPRSGRLQMGATGPGGKGPVEQIELTGKKLQPGQVVEMTFHFEHTEPAEVDVAVVERDGSYSEVPLPGERLQPGNPPKDNVVSN